MKLTKKQLQLALDRLTKYNGLAFIEREKIYNHCNIVYGYDPADIDNDEFIDSCGEGGVCGNSMSVEKFENSMEESIKRYKNRNR